MSLDPVTLEVIKGAVLSTRREMETVIERTSMSPVIREKKDYFASIFDVQGRLVTGSPLPIGANIMQVILEEFPVAGMRPGDLYWYNDCYLSRGGVSHFPDMIFAAPVFQGERLVAFSVTFGHFQDIGGMVTGSMPGNATEAWQEGIMVPPVKIYDAGRLNEALMKVFLRNTRFPEIMTGDIRAVQAGCKRGATRLLELAERFGIDTLCDAFEQMMAQSAAASRAAFDRLPDGTFTFTEYVDADPLTGDSPAIQVSLQKADGRLVIDTTGSGDQARGCINFIMHEYVPPMMYGHYFIAPDPSLLVNHGLTQVVDRVLVREGSILRPQFPRPLAFRSVTMLRVTQAIMGTLALATGGATPAATPSYIILAIRTTDPETGRPALVMDGLAVGYGARPDADGLDAIYYVAQKNFPAEFMDLEFPLQVRRYSLRLDSGGPGRYRGGCGVVKEFQLLAPDATLMVRMDNVKFPPWGVNGGMGGRPGRFVINPGTEQERVLPPMSDTAVLRTGDVLRIETTGGGGWGHPFDREPELVAEDVAGGMVSVESARLDYGVVLDPVSLRLDATATARRRESQRPPVKMFHRTDYFEQ